MKFRVKHCNIELWSITEKEWFLGLRIEATQGDKTTMAHHPVTVAELIVHLAMQEPTRVVVLQSDAEGNGYRYMHGLWTGAFDPDSEAAGLERLTQEDEEEGYSKEDIVRGKPCVVLFPGE
jgi:hypothetical protein